MQIKKFLSKLFILSVTVITCYIYPITSYAIFSTDDNTFHGTYQNLTKQSSFIKITSEYAFVNLVYNGDEKKYITANNGWGNMTNGSFTASFEKYTIKKSNGQTVKTVNRTVLFYGTYEKTSDYIDITTGGMIYEKKL